MERRALARESGSLAAKILARPAPPDPVGAAIDRAILTCHERGLHVGALILMTTFTIMRQGGADRLFHAVMAVAADLDLETNHPPFSEN